MATYHGLYGQQKTGAYYCSNCGAGLGCTGDNFKGRVTPDLRACPNCHTTRMDGGLVFPTSGSHVGADGRRTGKFHRGPAEREKLANAGNGSNSSVHSRYQPHGENPGFNT